MPRPVFRDPDPYFEEQPWPHEDIDLEMKHCYRLWYHEEDGNRIKIGEVCIVDSPYIIGAYQISSAFIHDPKPTRGFRDRFRGKGLAQDVYFKIMQEFGPLHPDWEEGLTEYALRVWKKIAEDPDIERVCYPFEILEYNEDKEPIVLINTGDGIAETVFPTANGWQNILNCLYYIGE